MAASYGDEGQAEREGEGEGEGEGGISLFFERTVEVTGCVQFRAVASRCSRYTKCKEGQSGHVFNAAVYLSRSLP